MEPFVRMLASLVRPNPLLQPRVPQPQPQSQPQPSTTTAKPHQPLPPSERLSSQPFSVFNWFMSPLRLAVVLKKYELRDFPLPRYDDSFFFDTKRHWGTALGVTCAALAPLMIAMNVWTYLQLRPHRLPRHPCDMSTFLSRWIAGDVSGPLSG